MERGDLVERLHKQHLNESHILSLMCGRPDLLLCGAGTTQTLPSGTLHCTGSFTISELVGRGTTGAFEP